MFKLLLWIDKFWFLNRIGKNCAKVGRVIFSRPKLGNVFDLGKQCVDIFNFLRNFAIK